MDDTCSETKFIESESDSNDSCYKDERTNLLNTNEKKSGWNWKERYIKFDKSQIQYFYQNFVKNKCGGLLNDFKTGLVFIIVVIITIMIAINPVQVSGFKQYSVFKYFNPTIENNITKYATAVRVKLRGSLLLTNYGNYANVTVMVSNLECVKKAPVNEYCVMNWTVPVTYSSSTTNSEVILTKYFPINKKYSNGSLTIQLVTNSIIPVPLAISNIFLTHSVENQVIYGALILIGVYVLIIFDLVHRAVAAMIGSLAALATLSNFNMRPSFETIISWLDFETLSLLFGMMLIVGIFSETGFFDWIAFKAYILAKGKPWPLLILLCTFASVISAFLDNVTTVLLLTPVSIRLCEALKMDPKKVLIAEVIFSNIGGTATAIGDPPNVILVSSKDLKQNNVAFTNFTLHLSIGTVFIFFFSLGFFRLIYGGLTDNVGNEDNYRVVEIKREIEVWKRTAYSITIASQEEAAIRALLLEKIARLNHELVLQQHSRRPSVHFRQTVRVMKDKYVIKDKRLLIKCSFILAVVIICFFLSSILTGFYLDLGWISLLGAVWIIVLSDFADFEAVVEKVEWSTLIFFAALFALMKALEELSVISWIGDQVSNLMLQVSEEYRLLVTLIIVLWLSAIASSFIDNIPFTTAMIPVVIELGNHMPLLPLVWALAFGACLGGNGTLIGASANVVVAGVAQQHGYSFSFIEFFKIGFPTMIFSTIIAMIYLLICHILIGWNYS